MRTVLAILALALPLAAFGQASKKDDRHIKEDVAAHRRIAQAHEAAARCLEAGKPEKECHAHFAKDCKGIAIGKFCGMKHRH
jgi:hypothetical protein